MNAVGLAMLLVLGVTIVATGLPVWALLVGVAGAFAATGLAAGTFDAGILSALGPRIVNLLEHDLLQALPLYVFVGVLLQRVAIADALFASAARLLRRTGAGTPLAALAVGTLVAPMNGSVASSSALLGRLVAPRLAGVEPARAITLVSVAATIGVVVPPSLVLILLGDAMLRAHTEASNLPGFTLGTQRIVNTQDILHAALLPAAVLLALWALVAWLRARPPASTDAAAPVSRMQVFQAATTALVIVLLLGGVFVGKLFAVEAAAMGGCLLAVVTLVTRALDRAQWESVLRDTLALSGALFALLVGATTFSLVFRVFGTDKLLAQWVLASPLPAPATAAAVLLLVALCAWVLDAFEMIFVIIPIVAPLLIVQLGDAQQVAVLLLLVLQLSFLVPPMGYAVLMARTRSGLPRVGTGALLRSLSPFMAAQVVVLGLVFAWPRAVHLLDPAVVAVPADAPVPSEQDVVRQMEEMSRQQEPEAQPPADAASK
ncbi:TRAP transporter large permease subunit [Caenimonas aquaedulcis]|uniref:TRAP transporter large permease subunit n=1 Tax=Caenimonas aquaedulcis TaxID=2793270 RepID=A0A931MG96_9BURK|nr:TRAP transporter large permease subunit [Caenimonas aquaedulcis]MBG9387095.1 TRAP transporter large permease subunit [Caenimonas aquaedulcis]